MTGKVNDPYRYWFSARNGDGSPRTGLLISDLSITVRNPTNTATMSTPTLVEFGGGLYFFDIAAAFTLAHGAGEYGVTIEITTSPFDTQSDIAEFFVSDFDDLGAAVAAVNTFVPVLGMARSIQAGDRIRLKVHLEVNGTREALPDTARLAVDIRDRANVTVESVSAIAPIAGSGEFAHEIDPLASAWIASGDVFSFESTITLSGFGSGTHVGQLEVSFADFGV